MNFNVYVEKLRKLIYNKEEGMPEMAPIVAMFLADYEPWTDEFGKPGEEVFLTSKDIQEMLEDIATINIDDIARIMRYLGYKIDNFMMPTWKMWKREEPIPLDIE